MTSQSLEGTLDCRPSTLERLAAFSVALLSLGAAGIHFAVLGSHFHEWWGYGVFFAVVASLQALWALPMVHSPGRWLYWAGAVTNAGVIVAWAITRTAGIPVGPSEGEVENAGFIDLLSVGFQAAIVVVCVAMATQSQLATRRLPAVALWAAILVVAVGVMALTSASLVDWASAAEGHTHGDAAAEADAHGTAPEGGTHPEAAIPDAHSDGGEAPVMPSE